MSKIGKTTHFPLPTHAIIVEQIFRLQWSVWKKYFQKLNLEAFHVFWSLSHTHTQTYVNCYFKNSELLCDFLMRYQALSKVYKISCPLTHTDALILLNNSAQLPEWVNPINVCYFVERKWSFESSKGQ